ncbi:MAG: hypothetical protein ACLSB9_19485 [Hydrogeniiclostridium mannosilyticum]
MKQSIYYSISPEQTAARFLRQTRRARAACIVLLAGLAALLLLLFGLSLARAISDMAFLLLELLVIACAVCLHTGFRAHSQPVRAAAGCAAYRLRPGQIFGGYGGAASRPGLSPGPRHLASGVRRRALLS